MIINSEDKIGLVLSGGGCRGIEGALGMYQCLKDNNIPVDYIYACSGGALAGAIIMSKRNPLDVMKELKPKDFLDMNNPFSILFGAPVFKIEPVEKAIYKVIGDSIYSNLVVNFTDLATHETFWAKGSRSTIVASMSIPKVFPPKKLTGTVYQNIEPYDYPGPMKSVHKIIFINNRSVVDGGVYCLHPYPDTLTINKSKHIFTFVCPAGSSPEEMEKSSHLKQCINWITEVEERGYRQSLPVYGDFDNVSIIRPSPINTPFFDWSNNFELYFHCYDSMFEVVKNNKKIRGLML